MKKRAIVVAAAAILVLLGVVYLSGFRAARTGTGAHSLGNEFQRIREGVRCRAGRSPPSSTFVSHLTWLSAGASAAEQLLTRHRDRKVRVLVVWEPILATDWRPAGDAALGEFRMAGHVSFGIPDTWSPRP
jgi:hypothetical protein